MNDFVRPFLLLHLLVKITQSENNHEKHRFDRQFHVKTTNSHETLKNPLVKYFQKGVDTMHQSKGWWVAMGI